MRLPRVDRRNGESPSKGIDTPPIDTSNTNPLIVEMGKARVRALTHELPDGSVLELHSRRNGESPSKGIDTRPVTCNQIMDILM